MKAAFFKLHIAILLAGFTAILGKLITLGETPLVWWRLVFTALVMWVWMLVANKKKPYPAVKRRSVFGIGAIIGLHWLCFFGSVKYANVSIALVCFSAGGFFSSLMEPFIMRSKWQWKETLLGLISIAGIYIIFHFDARYKFGIFLGVLGSLLSALFSTLNKKYVDQMDGVNMTAYEMIGALTMVSMVLPFMVFYHHVLWVPVRWDWLWLGILSVMCTVWAFLLQLQALKYISAFTLNISYNLEPVYGIILAFFFFQENQELSLSFYTGVALIILSIVVQMALVYRRKVWGKLPVSGEV